MKSIFKRSAIGLVVLGMAGSSFAAMSQNSNNNNNAMWWPHLNGAFIGADGLYLRPQNGDLDFVTIVPTVTTGSYSTKAISPNYNWGWRVYAGIKFTDNDDVTVSWMNFNNNYTSDVDSDDVLAGTTVVPRWLAAVTGADFDGSSAAAKVTFNVDEAYAVWGHTINFNNPWSLRFAAGVEFAEVNSNLSVGGVGALTVDGDLISDDVAMGNKASSKMQGWGPRLELDATYHLPYGFAWFARTNIALLSASRKVSLAAFEADPDGLINTFDSTFTTRNVVVPKLGMKIGASYSYFFGQAGAEGACGTTVSLEAGWQVDSYIHAIERPTDGFATIVGEVPDTDIIMANTKVSNFTDQGAFVGLKVSSDWL